MVQIPIPSIKPPPAPIRPRGPYVLIELRDPVLKSGILMPDNMEGEGSKEFYVLAVGDGMLTDTGVRVPIEDLRPGDRVRVSTHCLPVAAFPNESRLQALVPEDGISAVYEAPLPVKGPKPKVKGHTPLDIYEVPPPVEPDDGPSMCPTCFGSAHAPGRPSCTSPGNHTA